MKTFTRLQLQYFRQKGRVTLMRATELAFLSMDDRFDGAEMQRVASNIMYRPDVYADSVLRTMRELRKRGRINYRCTDQVNSIYRKIRA